jgi:chromate transporter
VILPSFIIIIIVVLFLNAIGENPHISGALTGIKAASCGLILYSAFRMGKQILKGAFGLTVAALSFIMIVFVGISAIWAIIGGGVAGLLYMKLKGGTG